MPDPTEEKPSQPEVRTIRQLVRLMHRYDLTAIDLADGARTIRLRRGSLDSAAGRGRGNVAAGSVPAEALPVPASGQAAPPVHAEPSLPVIESPMVGTFYSSSSPEAPPYVSAGSTVRPETTVCVIEAMKVFTDIPARVSGTIVEVLVKNGQPVEYGQPLFRVSP